MIGFCFGGYATYVAACTVDGVSAAMPFYGGGIAARVGDMQPKCPTQFHFGDKDAAIPLDDLQKIKDALQDSRSMSMTTQATVLHATTGTLSMRGH